MQQTVPAEDNFPTTVPARSNITPLARAALMNGVSFEDVQAYCEGQPDAYTTEWYETLVVPPLWASDAYNAHVLEMRTDTVLDAALAKSVLAEGSIEHARLWWLGVL